MEPLGIHHVSINVADAEVSRRFYLEVLGGVERNDRPAFSFGGAWIDFGGQQLHLIEGELPANKGQHFAIRVGDLAATVDELRGRGLKVRDPQPVGANLQTFVLDPDGNLVEIHEARESRSVVS
jgi:catechol 2,3-dioxygenase-like lactoylglutathione lyase family enzyme